MDDDFDIDTQLPDAETLISKLKQRHYRKDTLESRNSLLTNGEIEEEGYDDLEFPLDLTNSDFPANDDFFGDDLEIPETNTPLKLALPRKGPTLIRPSDLKQQKVGEMTYDPITQKWKGNESMLDEFDAPMRPKLIPHTTNVPNKIGEMVFDPVNMCWMGNDQDALLFDHIETLQVSKKAQKHNAFILSKELEQALTISEARHKLFIGSWYPRVVQTNRLVARDTSKTYLYEIRMQDR